MLKRTCMLLAALCLMFMAQGVLLAQTEFTCDQPLIADAQPSYYIGLGNVRFDRGEYTSAVRAYTCAIDLQPEFAPTYADRGYAFAALQDSNRALEDYNRALELDEGLIAAYNNRGTLYTNLGNFGLAINDFSLVIALDADNAIAYNNRGVVHAAEGNFDLAIADFQQAIALDPEYSTPHASLAAAYSALAAKSYHKFVEIEGRENARLPAGTPGEVLRAVDDSLRDGNFTVWLSLLSPARG